MENFRLGQLTKELVAAKLRAIDDPCAAAAAIIQAAISVALATPMDPARQSQVIEEACKGGITGLLLAEQSVAKGAVAILHKVVEIAAEHHIDPTLAMESALRGIADLRRFILPERLAETRSAIDAEFMGAGEFLCRLVDAQAKAEKAAAQSPQA